MSAYEPPAASEPPPRIVGITILSSRDAGSANIWEFKINPAEEQSAIDGLLDSLTEIDEFSLADHSRGDYESSASYRKEGDQYRVMIGGHGWMSEWNIIGRDTAVADTRKQAQYNYGATCHHRGHLTKRK